MRKLKSETLDNSGLNTLGWIIGEGDLWGTTYILTHFFLFLAFGLSFPSVTSSLLRFLLFSLAVAAIKYESQKRVRGEEEERGKEEVMGCEGVEKVVEVKKEEEEE